MSDLAWFALRCAPQRERMVQKILRYHGLKAFVKTEQRLRRKTKRDPVRKPIAFVAASSYVFIGLPADDPSPWKFVHRYHMIHSVVSLNGRPVQLDARALGDFLGFDDFDMPDYFKFFRTSEPAFGPGDMVRIDTPSFDGLELRVKDIQRGEALFDLVMLGRTTEIRVALDQVFKAA
jgi:transcription antitermination factor NusG